MTTAGALTPAQADAILKVLYPDRRVKVLGYEGNPTLALLPKSENFVGKSKEIPIWYGGNQGGSRNFQKAQANKTGGLFKAFNITRKKDYGLTSIETEAILASANDPGSFLQLARTEVDNTVRNVSRNIAISMFRNHGGARGQVGSIASTALTLANTKDVSNFEVGMTLVQSTTDGTSGSQGAAAAAKITRIDRRAGILYASAWTGFSANDYLFREGDFGASITGLPEWLPSAAPSVSENFNGVDRSTDTRLYGMYHDGSAQSKSEALEDLDTKLTYEGGMPEIVIVNPFDFNDFRKELGSDVVYEKVSSPDMPTVSFKAIAFNSQSGKTLKVVSDRNCPFGDFYMLQPNTWEFASLGPAPRILEAMGNKFIWDHDGDSVEVRVGLYGELGCYAPGLNGRGKFH